MLPCTQSTVVLYNPACGLTVGVDHRPIVVTGTCGMKTRSNEGGQWAGIHATNSLAQSLPHTRAAAITTSGANWRLLAVHHTIPCYSLQKKKAMCDLPVPSIKAGA